MEIRIYVANLAKYNEGELVGEWITLPADPSELEASIREILGDDEEIAIHDFESFFPIGEYDNPYKLNELLQKLQYQDRNLVESLYAHIGNLQDVLHVIEQGDYTSYHNVESLEDLAYEMVKDGSFFGTIPESIQKYVDFKKIANDLDCEGWSLSNRIAVYVF